jgi:hypothetical protein
MPKAIITLLAALAFAGVAAGSAAHAEDLEFRAVVHVTSAQSQDVGDVEGHVLSLVRASGIASFQDGSTATYKTEGTAIVDGNRTIFKGMITVIGGKGRFAGAKGEGGYNGARPGTGPDLFVDQMISVKK